MLIMLIRIVIMMLGDFRLVMVQFEPPENLMRMPHCEEQCDKQKQQAMGAKRRHPSLHR